MEVYQWVIVILDAILAAVLVLYTVEVVKRNRLTKHMIALLQRTQQMIDETPKEE